MSDVKLTLEPGPSMNSVLLRWKPSLNIRNKLKGQCKTIKYGSETSLVPSLASHSLSFNTFLVTLSLYSSHKTVIFYNLASKFIKVFLSQRKILEGGEAGSSGSGQTEGAIKSNI